MSNVQFANVISWFATYEGARSDLVRLARLDNEGFWIFHLDGFSVSDKAIREHYA